MQPRQPLKRSEWLLFLAPLLVLAAALVARPLRLKLFPVHPPAPGPAPVPKPARNLYSNISGTTNRPINGRSTIMVSGTTIGSVSVSPDGKLIYTGHLDPKARFSTWDAASGALIRHFGFGVSRFSNAEALLSPDGKIIGYGFGGWNCDQLVLFDSATGKVKRQIQKTNRYFALNNEVVAMPTKDSVSLFSTKEGRYLYKLQHRAREFFPSRPEFSPEGKLVLWLGSSRSIHKYDDYANKRYSDEIVLFDWKKKKLIKTIEFPQINLVRARFSGDGKVILAVGLRHYWLKKPPSGRKIVEGTGQLFAIDVGTGKQLYTKSLGWWSKDFAVSPDGRWFAFFNHPSIDNEGSGTLSIYEVKSGKEFDQILNTSARMSPRKSDRMTPRKTPRATCWSPDSQTLYVEQGNVKRLRLQRDGSWHEISPN